MLKHTISRGRLGLAEMGLAEIPVGNPQFEIGEEASATSLPAQGNASIKPFNSKDSMFNWSSSFSLLRFASSAICRSRISL